MKRLLPFLLAAAAGAADKPAAALIQGLEARYNHVRTLQIFFRESFTAQNRPRKPETGTLYLSKPGRMRWEYAAPAGKLFVSDGKFFYFYSPSSGEAEKTPVKESDDMRAPLGFLLGKLKIEQHFENFQVSPDAGGSWLTAEPKSAKAPYTQVRFLAAPDSRLLRVRITGQDQSILEFEFADEVRNPALAAELFRFEAPAGVRLVETGN